MADSDRTDDSDTQTVEVFEPGMGGYQRSATAKKQAGVPMPPPAKPPAPASEALEKLRRSQAKPPVKIPPPAQPRPTEPPQAAVPVPAKPAPQPKPGQKQQVQPNKKKRSMPADAEGQGQMLAESVVNGFVGALKAQAERRGGHLLPEDIEALSASFEKQTEKLASNIAKTMSVYADSHARTQWDPERVNAFDRILVKQFSRLLADDAEAVKNPEVISRRMLSGLFSAVRMMCGPERIEQLEQDAHLIMQKVRDELEGDFEWEVVYANPDTQRIMRDLLVEIAPHFIDMERRLDWLLSVINGHLTPVGSGAIGADWRLSGHGLLLVVEALFAEMKATLDEDLGRLRITKAYGAEALETILTVMEGIQHHRDIIAGR